MKKVVGPFAYTKQDIAGALRRLGYERFGETSYSETRIDPEMLIAAMIYSRDEQWKAAVAVVICKADIDWNKMMRISIDYGFAGTLRGIIEAVRSEGYTVGDDDALAQMDSFVPLKPIRIRKVLKTYVG